MRRHKLPVNPFFFLYQFNHLQVEIINISYFIEFSDIVLSFFLEIPNTSSSNPHL